MITKDFYPAPMQFRMMHSDKFLTIVNCGSGSGYTYGVFFRAFKLMLEGKDVAILSNRAIPYFNNMVNELSHLPLRFSKRSLRVGIRANKKAGSLKIIDSLSWDGVHLLIDSINTDEIKDFYKYHSITVLKGRNDSLVKQLSKNINIEETNNISGYNIDHNIFFKERDRYKKCLIETGLYT